MWRRVADLQTVCLSIVSWTSHPWRTLESSVNDYTDRLSRRLKGQSCSLRTNRKDATPPVETSVPVCSYSCCLLPGREHDGNWRGHRSSHRTHTPACADCSRCFKRHQDWEQKEKKVSSWWLKKEPVICAKKIQLFCSLIGAQWWLSFLPVRTKRWVTIFTTRWNVWKISSSRLGV